VRSAAQKHENTETHARFHTLSRAHRADARFALLCHVRVRAFGEMAVECAPVYYMYGAALFCKAQEESDVFGAPAADASAARDAKPAAAAPAPSAPQCAPGDKGKGKAAAAAPADDDSEDAASSDDDSDGDGDADAAPESDMQLAWENLEYARLIYSGGVAAASDGAALPAPCAPEHAAALAQCHVKLGQISLEEEQFEAALAEFEKALSLFRTLQPPSHRRVAGVLYDAALALQQLERPAEALARFGEAIAACQRRLTELRMAAPAAGAAADPAADAEAKEIGATIEDMRAREEELRGSAADEARTKEALKQAFAGMAGAASAAPFDAPKMGTSAPAADLGVVGRGVTRITPVAAGAGATTTTTVRRVTPQAAVVAPAAPKRTLEDALASGGGGGGGAEGGGAKAAKAEKPADEAGECKQQ
jgi:nuclear autoantigenic sperm protein